MFIRRLVSIIFEFPFRLIALPWFVWNQKKLMKEFNVGDLVRTQLPDPDVIVIYEEKILSFPPAGKGGGVHSLFVDRDPWEVTKVECRLRIGWYLQGVDFGHPCRLTITNKKVIYGQKVYEYLDASLVEKVK